MKTLNIRCRICDLHMKAECVFSEGAMMRFCQQCSRLDSIDAFDGKRRSCREGLMKIGERRRERMAFASSTTKVRPQPRIPSISKFLYGHASYAACFCVGGKAVSDQQGPSSPKAPKDKQETSLKPKTISSDELEPELSQPTLAVMQRANSSLSQQAPAGDEAARPMSLALALGRQNSAPIPENTPLRLHSAPKLGLTRAQSVGWDDKVRRTLTRRISVTIRADGDSNAESPGSESHVSSDMPEQSFKDAAFAAAQEYYQNLQAKAEDQEPGKIVLANPYSRNARPISVSVQSQVIRKAQRDHRQKEHASIEQEAMSFEPRRGASTVTSAFSRLSRSSTLPIPRADKSAPLFRPCQQLSRASSTGGHFAIMAADPYRKSSKRIVFNLKADSGSASLPEVASWRPADASRHRSLKVPTNNAVGSEVEPSMLHTSSQGVVQKFMQAIPASRQQSPFAGAAYHSWR
eukprot:scaffold432863_cov45-Prasinocladus_malaysianus.AAC.1